MVVVVITEEVMAVDTEEVITVAVTGVIMAVTTTEELSIVSIGTLISYLEAPGHLSMITLRRRYIVMDSQSIIQF
jgi:hypothetical protein